MAKIEPSQARFVVTEEPGAVRVTIPVNRTWSLILFVGFWLCGWAFGEFFSIYQLLAGKWESALSRLFTIAWLGAWTVAGAYIISTWLWGLAGREVILLRPDSLTLRRKVFGMGRSDEFDPRQIRKLRVPPLPFDARKSPFGRDSWFWKSGSIAFDYGASTHRFGFNLDEAEAKLLLEAIKKRLPLQEAKRTW